MHRRFTCLLLAAALLSLAGCGVTGESTLDAMKRRAQAQAEANKEAEERAKQKAAQAAKNPPPPKNKDEEEDPPVIAENPKVAKPATKSVAAKGTDAKGTAVKAPSQTATGEKIEPVGELTVEGRPVIPVKSDPPPSDIQRRNKSAVNLEQIIGALNKYARERGTFPTQAIVSKRLGRPLLSWRVAILPYLGLGDFYQEFKLEEPWDSPHNLTLLKHIPAVYVSPERCDEKTNYLAPHGPGTAFNGIRGKDPLSFADGADTTLVVLEVDDSAAVPWTKPEDFAMPTGEEKLKARLGNLRGEGFLATFGNGYVVMIRNEITEGQLSWMLSTDGDDYLTDRTIILDATVPDVALVTTDTKPDEGKPDENAAGDSAKTKNGEKGVASSARSSSPDRIRGLPPVKLPTPPPKPVRLPVPSEDELAKARDQLRDIYHEEYKQSKVREERQKLAIKMLSEAPRLEADPAAYHEILRMVREIAVHVGDVTTALKAVELLETKLEIPPLLLRLKTLDELTGTMGESTQSAAQIAAESEKVFISAYEGDDFPSALEAHRIHMGMLRKSNDRAKIAKASAYRPAIVEAEKMYRLVPAALSALATNADNTEANEVAGKYFCLVKEEWELGLPMLARGNDLKLQILARMDLEQEKSGQQIVQLADQYWDLAQEHKHPQRRSLELRAAFHYSSARPLLMPGVELVKAEKRIDEVQRTYGSGALTKARASAAPILPTPKVNPKDDSG